MNKSNKNKLWIYLSLVLAMVVDNFVFPESILQWKPMFTLLVLIYWNMALPDKVGIVEALFIGLIRGLQKQLLFQVLSFLLQGHHFHQENLLHESLLSFAGRSGNDI